jgi:hypothetical protein
MSELLSRGHIAKYLSIAVGAIGLSGCGSLLNENYTQSKWKVGYIKYSWDKGSIIPDSDFAQTPTISDTNSSLTALGIINISGIHTINSVSVESARES